MKKIEFRYFMEVAYSVRVSACHFTFKCIPKDTDRQKCVDLQINIVPEATYSFAEDGFGNSKIIGSVAKTHGFFSVAVSGIMEIPQVLYEELEEEGKTGMYRYPYGKTIPGAKLKESYNELRRKWVINSDYSTYEQAQNIMHYLYEEMQYIPGVTSVDTTAEEAWNERRGVCQDYAHIFIAMCRMCKIPARYVTGLMIGEGQSHAWAEVLCGNRWIGMDPTNDLLVDENYVKFSHGRDATDCKINLGVIVGGGAQTQTTGAVVSQIVEE